MKRTFNIGMAILLCFLTGCGAYLMPRWLVDLDNMKYQSTSFAAADSRSLYRVSRSYGGTIDSGIIDSETIDVEQFDLQGARIQSYSIAYPYSYFDVRDLVRAPGNAFYLPVEDFDEVLFSDPDTGTSWVGVKSDLPADRIPYIRDGQVNAEGELIFIGWTRTVVGDADPVWEWGVGRIGSDGHLKSYNVLPDVGNIFTLYKNDHGGFDAVGSLPRQDDGVVPRAFLEFDAQGNLVQRTDQLSSLAIFGYARHRWIGEQDGKMGMFDNTGKRLNQVDFQQSFGLQTIDVKNGFYTLGTFNGVAVGDLLFGGAPRICFHDESYVRQWCETLNELSSYLISGAQHSVDEDGRLLLSFELETRKLTSVGVDIQSFMKGVYGDLEVRGEQRHELRHVLFSSEGKRVLQAQAEPYFHRGAASLCFLEICVAKEEIHPGFGGFSDTVLLPGGRIYSFASYWNGRPASDRKGQLLYWGP